MTSILRGLTHCAVAFLILATFSALGLGQEVRERELKPSFDSTLIQIPVEVVSIKLRGEEVEPGKKIKAGDDWLRGVSFTLKNVSDKPIAYVAITLQFSEPEDAAHPEHFVVYFLSYGLDITSKVPSLSQKVPKAIEPGEMMDLVLSNEKYPIFLNVLAQAKMTPNVATAKYDIHSVAFENEPDIVWRGGNLMRRDPNDPNKFNVVERYTLPAKRE
jgi:hypothetical protein